MRAIATLVMLILIPSLANAGGFRRRCCNVERIIEVPVVAAVANPVIATFVPIQVPTYSVTYAPNVYQQTQEAVYQQMPQTYDYAAQSFQQHGLQQPYRYVPTAPGYEQGYAQQGSTLARSQAALQQLLQINPQELTTELSEVKAILEYYEHLIKCLEMLHKVPTKPPPTPPTKSTQPGNADPPVPQAGSPSLSSGPSAAISIFNVKCAACHESKVAASNGKGFTLLNGMQVANLTDAQKKKIAVKTYRGEMPKQPNKFNIPPLTDEEVGAIMAWLN